MEPTRHDTDSRQLLAERPVSQCTVVTGKVLGIDPDNSAVKLSTVQAYFVYSTYLLQLSMLTTCLYVLCNSQLGAKT